jgi:hypothetical protein
MLVHKICTNAQNYARVNGELRWCVDDDYGETITCIMAHHGVQTVCAMQDEDCSLLREHTTRLSLLVNHVKRNEYETLRHVRSCSDLIV